MSLGLGVEIARVRKRKTSLGFLEAVVCPEGLYLVSNLHAVETMKCRLVIVLGSNLII